LNSQQSSLGNSHTCLHSFLSYQLLLLHTEFIECCSQLELTSLKLGFDFLYTLTFHFINTNLDFSLILSSTNYCLQRNASNSHSNLQFWTNGSFKHNFHLILEFVMSLSVFFISFLSNWFILGLKEELIVLQCRLIFCFYR